MEASEALYELSGRMFTGACGPVTIRPVSRPTDIDMRSLGASLSPVGWYSSSGFASAYGSFVPGVLTHYGKTDPPEIQLPWPVREVTQVKIDGTVIPGPYDPVTQEGEWELRDAKTLVRVRPTPSFVPTARYGWPTSQITDMPDTQEGTFSVTFMFGQDPPALGVGAARKLAEFIALPKLGDNKHYPQRVTQMARQGVTAQVTDVMDILKTGATGIYEVDIFLLSVNPHKADRQSVVWSPDMPRPRRQSQNAS
jgi:hypothetical protein